MHRTNEPILPSVGSRNRHAGGGLIADRERTVGKVFSAVARRVVSHDLHKGIRRRIVGNGPRVRAVVGFTAGNRDKAPTRTAAGVKQIHRGHSDVIRRVPGNIVHRTNEPILPSVGRRNRHAGSDLVALGHKCVSISGVVVGGVGINGAGYTRRVDQTAGGT